MKGISVFILGAATAFAADFVTGQAARLVIGQTTFSAADPNSSSTVLGAASGVAYAANTLFVADSNRIAATPSNDRVLIFSNLSSMLPQPTSELVDNSKCPVCVGQATVVLGQPDFVTLTSNLTVNQSNLRQPTAVASDGVHLVVADTNHNRVLIWNRIPTSNDTNADVVVGQTDFGGSGIPPNNTPTATSLRGPQGVWIQSGKLFVADTQNNRILIYNHIPTSNGAAADVVLGQPDFTTFVQQDLNQQTASAANNTLLNPSSVTSDGVHLFVADLGYNRVMIWNSIPTTNQAPADVEIGQPDFTTGIANYAFTGNASAKLGDGFYESPALCTVSNGRDASDNYTFPNYCNATLNLPRFAISDGTRLFVADGGNDRVLEYYTIPTQNAAVADVVIGQTEGDVVVTSDAADGMNTPTSLALDGTNLYVADPYNRRVLVYTISPNPLPYQAMVNSANTYSYATDNITVGGSIVGGDVITVTIVANQYAYTVKGNDSLVSITDGIAAMINAANDPNVTAYPDEVNYIVKVISIIPGPPGNTIKCTVKVSSGAKVTATAAYSTLQNGQNASSVAPGTLVTISGTNLSAGTVSADMSQPQLPTTLGGTQVYINGIRSPLLYVSPTEIHAQVSWVFTDTDSVNAYVRSVMPDGSVMFTSAVAAAIVPANPGIFGDLTTSNPELGFVYHASSNAVGVISVDGTAQAADVATVTIQDRTYSYTVQESDTLTTVRDALVVLINLDPFVQAQAAGPFQRIILTARLGGPDGDNISYSASASGSLTLTAFGSQLCCANVKGSLVTTNNPASPGELITVYATGLGLPVLSNSIQSLLVDGLEYPANGPVTYPPDVSNDNQSVSAIVGGATADVLQATLLPGTVGTYEVLLHLNGSLPSNQYTQLTIAQQRFISNVVVFPVYSLNGH
jgi:uncharacterized protein (TIGR03437 family)